MSWTEQLLYPLSDALQIDLELKDGLLYGKQEIEGVADPLVDGIPILSKFCVVDSVVDAHCGTAGVIVKVAGNLHLAIICDDRAKKLTFFVVDGTKAGLGVEAKNGRLGILDKFNGWSRKRFYALIANGVKATFTRSTTGSTWTKESVGPEAALEYLEKRNNENKSKSADDWNKENEERRHKALTHQK